MDVTYKIIRCQKCENVLGAMRSEEVWLIKHFCLSVIFWLYGNQNTDMPQGLS